MFGISEIAVVLIVVVIVLAVKKLPGLARSAGQSVRILKKEARAMKSDGARDAGEPTTRTIYRASDSPKGSGGRRGR